MNNYREFKYGYECNIPTSLDSYIYIYIYIYSRIMDQVKYLEFFSLNFLSNHINPLYLKYFYPNNQYKPILTPIFPFDTTVLAVWTRFFSSMPLTY